MHIGSFTYYAFVSAPLGSSNLRVIYCLVEESDIKVQGRLLPARNVHSGVDMGRSTSVYFFCLAMDPFVVLNQIPQVLVVAGYVDDTTIVGRQNRPELGSRGFSEYKEMEVCWYCHGHTSLLASRILQQSP